MEQKDIILKNLRESGKKIKQQLNITKKDIEKAIKEFRNEEKKHQI